MLAIVILSLISVKINKLFQWIFIFIDEMQKIRVNIVSLKLVYICRILFLPFVGTFSFIIQRMFAKHFSIFHAVKMISDWRGCSFPWLVTLWEWQLHLCSGRVMFLLCQGNRKHPPTLNFPLCGLVFEPLAVDMQFNFNPLNVVAFVLSNVWPQ